MSSRFENISSFWSTLRFTSSVWGRSTKTPMSFSVRVRRSEMILCENECSGMKALIEISSPLVHVPSFRDRPVRQKQFFSNVSAAPHLTGENFDKIERKKRCSSCSTKLLTLDRRQVPNWISPSVRRSVQTPMGEQRTSERCECKCSLSPRGRPLEGDVPRGLSGGRAHQWKSDSLLEELISFTEPAAQRENLVRNH